ncbi:MAG: hypothetical protein IJ785_05905 [Bacteroidales bacterium]|nr:hypothetical protein [Bacteroidales bacterium]
MEKNFDILWEQRRLHTPAKCPLSNEQVEEMIQVAINAPHQESEKIITLQQRKPIRAVRWAAAAACVAFLVLPVSRLLQSNVNGVHMATVKYKNQEVMIACNNNYNANAIISSFDTYLNSL